MDERIDAIKVADALKDSTPTCPHCEEPLEEVDVRVQELYNGEWTYEWNIKDQQYYFTESRAGDFSVAYDMDERFCTICGEDITDYLEELDHIITVWRTMENKILKAFSGKKELTSSEIASIINADIRQVRTALKEMVERGLVAKKGRIHYVALFDASPSISPVGLFYDWEGVIPRLRKAYSLRIPTLIIGPKGVGKTMAFETLGSQMGKKIYGVNFSTRAREYHFVGQQRIVDGDTFFEPGPLPVSMTENQWLMLDELSAAPPGVLLRLNEALDFRRKVEIYNTVYKAGDDWWCAATINPLDRFHLGNNELPGQILSRFPIRIAMSYPDANTEYSIVKMHVANLKEYAYDMNLFLKAVNELRQSDLPYLPSIRDSIAAGKLLASEAFLDDTLKMVLIDIYQQWGNDVTRKAYEIVKSVTGRDI